MTVVLDASAAVRVVLNPGQVSAYSAVLAAAETLLAPELIVAELADTFWKYFRAGSLSRADCEQGLAGTLALWMNSPPWRPYVSRLSTSRC